MNYIFHLIIMLGIYLILAYGLNLLVGFGGLLSLAHAVFFGIGAYACSLLLIKAELGFFAAMISSAFITGCFAAAIGIPALRFRGDPFVLVTLGFQMIIYTIIYNWVGLTKGSYGITGIPRPKIFGYELNTPPEYLLCIIFFVVIIAGILFIIYRSPYGLALKALRDNEMAAESLGKSPVHLFLFAFIISGVAASVAGGLYATYVTFIDPSSFTINDSIFILTLLLVGGAGNRIGPFLGTLFMILLPEALRLVGLPDTIAPNVRQIIYGLSLIILMFIRPRGIAGEFKVK